MNTALSCFGLCVFHMVSFNLPRLLPAPKHCRGHPHPCTPGAPPGRLPPAQTLRLLLPSAKQVLRCQRLLLSVLMGL